MTDAFQEGTPPERPGPASRRVVLTVGAAGVVGALAGCEVYGPPEAPPPPSADPEPDAGDGVDDGEPPEDDGQEGSDEEGTDEEGSDEEERNGVTLAELEEADGRDGRRCWVAVDGIVYEIDGFDLWQDGQHTPSNGAAYCGADMSDVIRQAPHGVGRVEVLTEIGPLLT